MNLIDKLFFYIYYIHCFIIERSIESKSAEILAKNLNNKYSIVLFWPLYNYRMHYLKKFYHFSQLQKNEEIYI